MRTGEANFGNRFQDVGNFLAARPKAYAAAGDVYAFDLATACAQRTNVSAIRLLKRWSGDRANAANVWMVGSLRHYLTDASNGAQDDSRATTVSRMRALRDRAIAGGMRLKTLAEINEEVREMRGER